MREAKHSTLINMLRPLATGLIKTAVTKALEAAIRTGLEQVDAQLSDIAERLEDAKNQEGTNKIDALKQSFADKKAEAQRKKEKAQEAARASSSLSLSSPSSAHPLTLLLPSSTQPTASSRSRSTPRTSSSTGRRPTRRSTRSRRSRSRLAPARTTGARRRSPSSVTARAPRPTSLVRATSRARPPRQRTPSEHARSLALSFLGFDDYPFARQ